MSNELPYIIAVDFDGCLCTNAWPRIGYPNMPLIENLIQRRRRGEKIILWTNRTGEKLEAAVHWCAEYGLRFDGVNENLPEAIDYFGNNCRKVFANEYWDDKAVSVIAQDPAIQITQTDIKM